MPDGPVTIADRLRDRADDERVALLFEDESWTWVEFVAGCSARAALLQQRRVDGPFHVGVLLDNVPEFPLWLGAAALAGAVVVGINPTRRGAELARDVTHTECQLVVTEPGHASLLDGLDLRIGLDRILDVESAGYDALLAPPRRA